MKKIIILLTACIILTLAFISCNTNKTNTDTVDSSSSESITSSPASSEEIVPIETDAPPTVTETQAVQSTSPESEKNTEQTKETSTEQTTQVPTTTPETTAPSSFTVVTPSTPSYPVLPPPVSPETETTAPELTDTQAITTEAETTEPVKPDVSISLFEDGKSDYKIVYDKKDGKATAFVSKLVSKLKSKHGITLESCDVATVQDPAAHEIIIGDARESSKAVGSTLNTYYDFAVEIKENSLILTANADVSYNFLYEYLFRDVFSKTANGNLTLTAKDSMTYGSSELFKKTYVEYWKEINGNCDKAFMLEITEDLSFTGTNKTTLPYRLYLPSNYDPAKEYPALIILHGAGHRGNNNTAPIQGIVPALYNHDNVPVDEAIVIVPQCPSGMQWVDYSWSNGNYSTDKVPESKAMTAAVELLESVIKNYAVDESRVYALGLSMGGYGTWDIITRHTDLFAGAVPICGGGDPSKAAVLKDLPIWTAHGDVDPTVSVENTRSLVKAIKDAGGTVINYSEFAGKDHGIGTYTCQQNEIIKWLFEQKKAD